jgi:hypothetical protein
MLRVYSDPTCAARNAAGQEDAVKPEFGLILVEAE